MAQPFYKYADNPTVYRGTDNHAFSSWDEFTKAGGANNLIETRAPASSTGAPPGFYVGPAPQTSALAGMKEDLNKFQLQTFEEQETPAQRKSSLIEQNITKTQGEYDTGLADYKSLVEKYKTMEMPNLYGDFNQLRQQQGIPQLEGQFTDTRQERRELPYTQRANTGNAGVATEGQLGAQVQQADIPLEAREANLIDRLKLANDFVTQAVNLKDKDASTAREALSNAINLMGNTLQLSDSHLKSLKADQQNLSEEQQREKDQAAKTLASILDLTKGSSFDDLDPETQKVITKAAANSSLTLGAIKTAMQNNISNTDSESVATLALKYPDAGIKLTDTFEAASSKLSKSRIYQDQVRGPVGSDSGVGPGKITKFTPDESKRLLAAGFNNNDISQIQADVNQYGVDKVVEGMSAAQATAIRNVLGGTTPTQEAAAKEASKQFLTKDYFKKLYPTKTLEEEAKKAGYMIKKDWARDVPDTDGYLRYLEQTVEVYREAGYTDQEILKMMQ